MGCLFSSPKGELFMFITKIKIEVDILVDDEDSEDVSKYTWFLSGSGYAATHGLPKKITYMHRWLMGEPNGWIDHINGNKLDNQKKNLRIVTPSQSRMNSAKQTPKDRPLTSKYKGVRERKDMGFGTRRWTAAIKYDGIKYHLGSFYTEKGAAKAYSKKAKKLFGKFARLNFAD